MADNPNVNKVVYGSDTLIDLTSDTATVDDVAAGKTLHLASGAKATGTASYAGAPENNGNANATNAILYGTVDSTSTATAYTATIEGLEELYDGVTVMLHNGVVTSAAGFTVNINGLGAKKCYNNLTNATQDTTIFNVAYTMMFVYAEALDEGNGGWWIYRGYDANTNTIGYQLRTNSGNMVASDTGYRYRIWLTQADGKKWVPINTSTSTNNTSARTLNTRHIDPFGRIVYRSTNGTCTSGTGIGATAIWDQYTLSIGYSYMASGFALTAQQPVYLRCAPQTDGSAQMEVITQTLPSSNDGKIYIHLGTAYSTTNMELEPHHPVYWHDGTGIRLWTGAESSSILPSSTTPAMDGTAAVGTATTYARADHVHPSDTSRLSGVTLNTSAEPYVVPVTNGAATIDIGDGLKVSDSGNRATVSAKTGTTSGTVAAGNHTHDGYQATLVSGTNIKTVNGNSLLGSGDLTISGGSGSKTTWYGTCSTAASTPEKVVACENFELAVGSIIVVHFSNGNTVKYTPKLNVNNTGAINITSYGSAGAGASLNQYSLKWDPDTNVTFVYTGSNWTIASVFSDRYTVLSGVSSTIATSGSKAVVWNRIAGTDNINGLGKLHIVSFVNANTYTSGPLYLNNTTIRVNGADTSASIHLLWDAGDTLLFFYDGLHMNYVAIIKKSIPIATASTLGGVKVGSGLSIDSSGVLSASEGSSYTLPAATASTLGGVKVGSGLSVASDGTLSASGGGGSSTWTDVSSYFDTTLGDIDARSNGSMVYLRIVNIQGDDIHDDFVVDISNSSVYPLDPSFTPCIWNGTIRSLESDPMLHSIYSAAAYSGSSWGFINFVLIDASVLDASVNDYSLAIMYPIAGGQ